MSPVWGPVAATAATWGASVPKGLVVGWAPANEVVCTAASAEEPERVSQVPAPPRTSPAATMPATIFAAIGRGLRGWEGGGGTGPGYCWPGKPWGPNWRGVPNCWAGMWWTVRGSKLVIEGSSVLRSLRGSVSVMGEACRERARRTIVCTPEPSGEDPPIRRGFALPAGSSRRSRSPARQRDRRSGRPGPRGRPRAAGGRSAGTPRASGRHGGRRGRRARSATRRGRPTPPR